MVSTNTINGAGDLTVNSDFTIQGSINGPGILIINANSTWPSGVLNRALTVGSLRTLTIPTAGFKSLYKNLTNNGTINWQAVSYTHLDVYKRQDIGLLLEVMEEEVMQSGWNIC